MSTLRRYFTLPLSDEVRAESTVDLTALERSQELLNTWLQALSSAKYGQDIKDTLARLECVNVTQKAALDKARLITFFGRQVSRDMVDLMDTLDEEAQKKGPLPPHARRLIDKMVETVNEMERESADCAAQFEAVTRNLKQIEEEITGHLEVMSQDIPFYSRRIRLWRKASFYIRALGLIAVAVSAIAVCVPAAPLALATLTFAFGALSPLIAIFSSLNLKRYEVASHSVSGDISILREVEHNLLSRIELLQSMGEWWSRVRDDVHHISKNQKDLALCSAAEVQNLREHWCDMQKELQTRSVALKGPIHMGSNEPPKYSKHIPKHRATC